MACKCKYITTICNISTTIIHSNYTRTAGKTNAVIPFAPLPGNRNSSVRVLSNKLFSDYSQRLSR